MAGLVNVTVLFTDMVGSTALASSVSADAADDLRREHFSILRQAVAEAGGTEVKNLGDGLMVVFSSASAALSCAVAMQQEIERDNRSRAVAVGLRVGLSGGEVSCEDDDYFGDPVIESARLCAVCETGQVLAAEIVRLTASRRSPHVCRPLGERMLKGLPDPIAVVEVTWEPLAGAAGIGFDVALPGRLAAGTVGVFAGRTAEVERWDERWKRACATERQVWLVGGEAGVGKTTLVSRLAARAHGQGGVVVYGRCDEDLGVPYQPWIEALSTIIERLPDESLHDHTAACGGALARIVPALAQRAQVLVPAGSDPEAERFALFGAVTDLLQRAATLAPTILVLDDLHWADRPTISLLRHVAGVAEPMRLVVVATYRQTDLGSGHPLVDALGPLHREPGVELVTLSGLDDIELLELMEATAGHEMDSDGLALRDAIAAETNGNAFFASEILRHLAESGAISRQEGRWVPAVDLAQQGLPVSVRHVVTQRVARLGPAAERLLRLAAVIGRDFDFGLIAEVADLDEDDALDLLDDAVAAALVHNVGPDSYTFAHALVEHTLYDELSSSRRSRAHRRVAEALERRLGDDPGDRIGELAHHWAAATVPEDLSKVVGYARRAGDRALEQLAPDEALRWYRQALDTRDARADDPTRLALLIGLGTAQRQTGDPAHRQILLDVAHAAQGIGDADLLIAAVLANHHGWASPNIDLERIAGLEAALAAAGPDPSAPRVRLLGALVAELTFSDEYDASRAYATEAATMARQLEDPRLVLASLIGLLTLPDAPGGEHLAWADEALVLAEELDDPVSLAIVAASASTSGASFGDRRRFDIYASACEGAAARVGQPSLLHRALGVGALRAITDGDLLTAEALADEHLQLSIDLGDNLVAYGGIISSIRFAQGRLPELRELLAGIAATPSTDSVQAIASGALLALYEQAHDREALHQGFEAEAAVGFARGESLGRLSYLCFMAQACHRLGDHERAVVLLDLIEPAADLLAVIGAASATHSVAGCAGMLWSLRGRHDLADQCFDRGLEITTGFQAPFLIACTQLEWACSLLERPSPVVGRAAALLAAAHDTAARHGFREVERQVLVRRSAAG